MSDLRVHRGSSTGLHHHRPGHYEDRQTPRPPDGPGDPARIRKYELSYQRDAYGAPIPATIFRTIRRLNWKVKNIPATYGNKRNPTVRRIEELLSAASDSVVWVRNGNGDDHRLVEHQVTTPDHVRELARQILTSLEARQRMLPFSAENRVAGALFAVLNYSPFRVKGSVPLRYIAEAINADPWTAHKVSLLIRKMNHWETNPVADQLIESLRGYSEKLSLSREERTILMDILTDPDLMPEAGCVPAPSSIVTAAIYLAGKEVGNRHNLDHHATRSQAEITRVTGKTEVTIRNVSKWIQSRITLKARTQTRLR